MCFAISGGNKRVHFNNETDCPEQLTAGYYAKLLLDGKLDLGKLRRECNQRLMKLPCPELRAEISFDDGSFVGWAAFKRSIQVHLDRLEGESVN